MRNEERKDGRYIDPTVGLLAGEGSQQEVRRSEERLEELAREAWAYVPSYPAREATASNETYYDRPVIKEPVWKWMVPAYFVSGGAAGAAALLGAMAHAVDGRHMRGLVTRCRWISAVGTALGTALLVADLGKPRRFLNMLRVLRPTSPMSVGSFVLAPATGAAAAAAGLANAGGRPGSIGNAAGAAAGLLGLPLAGYTAVLVSNSAVPVWQATRRTLPAVFVASAVNAASSVLELTSLSDAERTAVYRFGTAGKIAELAAGFALERDAAAVERVAGPLKEGVSGSMWKAARLCTLGSLFLGILPNRFRWKRVLAAWLGLAGSSGTKFAVWRAGVASARDPRATFEQQRAGFGAAELSTTPAAPAR